MTKTGVLKGKYAYMSPEQVMGKKLDGRSDIFSLAIVLYEITVGKRLFKSNSELRVLRKITEDKIEAPIEIHPKYPKVLNDIIMKALSRNRANRYSSGQEFSADLEKYLTESNNMVSTLDISKWLKELFKDEIVQRILNNKKLFNEADVFLEREELHKNKPLEKSETIKKEMKVEFTNEFEFDRNNKESDLKLNFDNLNKEEILNQVNKDPKLPTISIKIKNKKKLTIKNIILSLIMLLLFYILIFSASVGYKIFSSNKYIEKSLSDSVEVDLPGHELNTRMELFCNKKYVYCNKDSIRVLESDKILNLAIEYKVKSKLFGVIPLDFNFNKKLNAAIKE
jgi:serine/threonine protein kinase